MPCKTNHRSFLLHLICCICCTEREVHWLRSLVTGRWVLMPYVLGWAPELITNLMPAVGLGLESGPAQGGGGGGGGGRAGAQALLVYH